MTYNSTYTGPQIDAAARHASIVFTALSTMLADARTYTDHTDGDVFWTAAEGFRYRVAASDATDHHLTTAGGVKCYVLPSDDGIYNFKAFNPAADGVTDDHAKMMLAINAVPPGAPAGNSEGNTIYFPDSAYFFGETIEVKRVTKFIGSHPGTPFKNSPVFKFPVDTLGMIVHQHNTIGSGVADPVTSPGWSTVIDGLKFLSAGGTDPTKHGIWTRGKAVIRNTWVEAFPGNGIHLVGGTDGNPALGNCNLFLLDTVSCYFNQRSGVYIEGTDANAGLAILVDCTHNGRWGIEDRSFLGNTFLACHSSINGAQSFGASSSTCIARFGGIYYHANPSATEAQYVATEPGSNASVWQKCNPGNFVEWEPGLPEGTYISGGPFLVSNPNAHAVFMNCYVEEGHGSVWLSQHSQYIGAIVNTPVLGAGGFMKTLFGENRGKAFRAVHTDPSSGVKTEVAIGTNPGAGFVLRSAFNAGEEWVLRHNAVNRNLTYGAGTADNKVAMEITTAQSNMNMGRSVPQPYITVFKRLGLGVGSSVRQHTTGSAAPSVGEYARGDIIFNRDPVAAGWAGWICVTAGTPGTWKRFGAIEA